MTRRLSPETIRLMADRAEDRSQQPTFAMRITSAWRKSVESIFECGRLLIEAKNALPFGKFQKMIDCELPFGARTAERLMAIGRDQRLANPTRASLLPPNWSTIYELTRLSDAQLEKAFADGVISTNTERADAKRFAPPKRHADAEIKRPHPINPSPQVNVCTRIEVEALERIVQTNLKRIAEIDHARAKTLLERLLRELNGARP